MIFKSFSRSLLVTAAFTMSAIAGNPDRPTSGYSYVPVNLSLVPDVAIPTICGAKTESNLSINIFAGSGGTLKGVEIGGIMNMEQGDVSGAQFAGSVNYVQGDVKGFQSSGAANIVKKNVYGVQSSEIVNSAGALYGTQVAGIANISGADCKGAQVSGILNTAAGLTSGAQIAGIVNIARRTDGNVQFGGIVNVTGNGDAVQIAGISNLADRINGAQFSLVNIARKVNGVQIGLINIADEVNGAPIGLFSYVKSVGLHYQFFVDETGFGNTALRCGGNNVYSLLIAGLQAQTDMGADNFTWSLGYGLGVRYDLTGRWYINADITAQLLQHQDEWNDKLNVLTRYRAGGGFRVNGHFAIIGGLSANTLLSRVEDGSGIAPEWLSNAKKKGDTWHRMWPGIFLGVEL